MADATLRIGSLVTIGLIAFFASFYFSQTVFGHGEHCDRPNPPCNRDMDSERYYVGQFDWGASNGIGGYIRTQNVAMLDTSCAARRRYDPKCDFVLHFLGQGISATTGAEWAEIGFWEGVLWDWSVANSPIVFNEHRRTSCDPGAWDIKRSFIAYHEAFYIYWNGISGPCPSNPARTVYIWWFKRSSWGNPPFDFTYFQAAAGSYQAMTEHFDNTHMEPNGTICFGTSSGCSDVTAYGLRTYSRDRNAWTLWTHRPDAIEAQAGYWNSTLALWWAFITGGW